MSVGDAGGSLCDVDGNYTLSLSGAHFGRRIVFHQIYIRLEWHPTLTHGEYFRLTPPREPPEERFWGRDGLRADRLAASLFRRLERAFPARVSGEACLVVPGGPRHRPRPFQIRIQCCREMGGPTAVGTAAR